MKRVSFKFKLLFESELKPNINILPQYLGLLRRKYKNLFCTSKLKKCEICGYHKCLYRSLFQKKQYPSFRPYIFTQLLNDGKTVEIHLKLFGKAVESIDNMILSIIRSEDHPLIADKNEYYFMVSEIVQNDNIIIYRYDSPYLDIPEAGDIILNFSNHGFSEVVFKTPLRIRYKFLYMNHFKWSFFKNSLLERIKYFSSEVFESPINIDTDDLDDISIIHSKPEWDDSYGRSIYENPKIELSGVKDSVIIKTESENVKKFLSIGEVLNVGEKTEIGFGNYRLNNFSKKGG